MTPLLWVALAALYGGAVYRLRGIQGFRFFGLFAWAAPMGLATASFAPGWVAALVFVGAFLVATMGHGAVMDAGTVDERRIRR